jgi:hypothetical protein
MPRSSRALLSAEIRTPANRGPQGPILSWALRLSETETTNGKVKRLPASTPCRARAPDSEEPEAGKDSGSFPPTADRPPWRAVRLQSDIHQDLSSGSPENSDVLIGKPIRK